MPKTIAYARFLLLLVPLFAGCSPAVPAEPTPVPTPPPGVVYVDPGAELGEISPLVLGSNYGPWVAVPFDLLPAAEESGVTVLRWPGGEWGDRNDIKEYQVDQIAAFAEQIGAELSISVRMMNGTPEQAAELVRYANIEKGYGIRYWGIANEPNYYAAALGEPYDTVRFNREWRAIAEAMKAVDDTIMVIGPEVDGYTANEAGNRKDEAGRDWMIEFLKANGDLVDIVSFHYYPFPDSIRGNSASPAELRANAAQWEATFVYLRSLVREHTGRDLPLAVTEFNSHWNHAISREGSPDSHFNAIWLAAVLGTFIGQDVYMGNHWLLTSRDDQGGWGLLSLTEVRPSYYTFRMYAMLGSRRVVSASGDPSLSVSAALREDGALTVMIVNLNEHAVTTPLVIRGDPAPEAEVWLFDAEHPAERLGVRALDFAALELPAASMTLLVFPAEGP